MMSNTTPRITSTPPTSVSLVEKGTDSLEAKDGNDAIPFHSVAELFRVIEQQQQQNHDFVTFKGVDESSFKRIEAGRDRRRRKFRFHFRPESRRLKVTVPSWPHEIVCQTIVKLSTINLTRMGVEENLYTFAGTTTYPGRGGSGAGGSGEGDATFTPRTRMGAIIKWPTLVVEAGLSQSLTSLRHDMHWWFSASNHEVKIVVLAKLYRETREIRLEKYVKDISQTRLGATETRNMPGLEPWLVQVVAITLQPGQSGNGNQVPQYTVDGGPLILDFELLFLRMADRNAGEADIVLTSIQLEQMAEMVWA